MNQYVVLCVNFGKWIYPHSVGWGGGGASWQSPSVNVEWKWVVAILCWVLHVSGDCQPSTAFSALQLLDPEAKRASWAWLHLGVIRCGLTPVLQLWPRAPPPALLGCSPGMSQVQGQSRKIWIQTWRWRQWGAVSELESWPSPLSCFHRHQMYKTLRSSGPFSKQNKSLSGGHRPGTHPWAPLKTPNWPTFLPCRFPSSWGNTGVWAEPWGLPPAPSPRPGLSWQHLPCQPWTHLSKQSHRRGEQRVESWQTWSDHTVFSSRAGPAS